MKQITRTSLLSIVGLLAMAVALPSHAYFRWDFNQSGTQNVTGNSYTDSDGGVDITVTVRGVSNTGLGSGANRNLQQGTVFRYGSNGLGLCNRLENSGGCTSNHSGGHEHSLDNDGGQIDMLLFSFDKAIELSYTGLGWSAHDSDMTLVAYTGAGAPSFAGTSYDDIKTDSSWTHIGNYNNQDGFNSVNAGDVSSTHWLVGPRNGYIAGSTSSNDHIKVDLIKGVYHPPENGVPEPASLALLSIGFAAFGFTRRRKQA